MLTQVTGDTQLDFFYDDLGNALGFIKNSTDKYYYIRNLQNDIVGILDASGTQVVEYVYDTWGKLEGVTGAMAATIGRENPLRYRGYYYDEETGFYYLQSRYYDPETGRFLNADNQLAPKESPLGFNLYTYCGNNPVNRIDPTGEAWWHWALGAAVVAVCAVAVVATAGGALAGMAAVAAVGSGLGAGSVATTVAAAAFITSATAFTYSAFDALASSSSPRDFANKGSWGTVAVTAGAAIVGGGSAYVSQRISSSKNSSTRTTTSSSTKVSTSRGSTGRTTPVNLKEQLAMEQVKSDPLPGAKILKTQLGDPRWPASEGWVKMAQNVNDVEIHFVYNQNIKIFDDFKFKP